MANPSTNGHAGSSSDLLASDVVPSVIDNAAWQGLQTTYDLKDPHTGDLLVSFWPCLSIPGASERMSRNIRGYWSNHGPLTDLHKTGPAQYKVASVKEQEAKQAVASAAKAFKSWKKVGALERRAIFFKALKLLEERKEEYIKISTTETTGTEFWS